MRANVAITLILLSQISGCAYNIAPEYIRLESTARYRELAMYEEAQIKQSGASSRLLYRQCYAYSKLKNYRKLFDCLDRLEEQIKTGDKAVTLFTAISDSDGSPTPHLMRAEAYVETGDYVKAISEGKKGYELSANVHSTFMGIEKTQHTIHALGLLALAHAFNGERDKAATYLNALKELPLSFAGIAQSTPIKNRALARSYIALGEYAKALELLQGDGYKGLRAFTSAFVGASAKGENVFATLELPNAYMVNKCLFETDRLKEAKAGFDELLKIPQTMNVGEIYWLVLFDRGRIAEQEGDRQNAIDFYRRAITVIEEQRSSIDTEASKIGFVGDKQTVYRQLVATLYADHQYAAAFEYVERSKARALVDMLASKQDFSIRSANVENIRKLLDTARNTETESLALAQEAPSQQSHVRSLMIRSRQQLSFEAPDLASLVSVSALDSSDVRALLPADETLVEYYFDDPQLIAFVLTKNGINAIKLDSRDLLQELREYRKHVESAAALHPEQQARKLYERLITPIEKWFGTTKLVIVPHNALHYLPFNALHDGNRYLIEKYAVRLLPSASVLKYIRSSTEPKPGNILAFGNPDLGDSRHDLVYAQNEAIAVAKTRPQSKVFLRKDATETAFEKYGSSFNYIHFATHGRFNADAPLKSAILLAKDAESDGMLTVDKLYSSKLDADLVTLSACETGLGKIANGDDIVGLTRGFLYAGASSIVASLWKVDDLATADLMTRFYTNMKTLDKREALRQAQLQTKKKYDHPFYWASFQLTGNPK